MRYLLIICQDPAELERMSDAERAALVRDYRTFTEGIVKTGNFRAGDPLEPATTAISLAVAVA